jgi:hypothetical protein
MQCATHERPVSQPTPSNCSIGRLPKRSMQNVVSSGSSATWVCRRTSSRSARSAARRISDGLTLKGEQGRWPRGPWRRVLGRGGVGRGVAKPVGLRRRQGHTERRSRVRDQNGARTVRSRQGVPEAAARDAVARRSNGTVLECVWDETV